MKSVSDIVITSKCLDPRLFFYGRNDFFNCFSHVLSSSFKIFRSSVRTSTSFLRVARFETNTLFPLNRI